MASAYLCLGSNVGDRIGFMRLAFGEITRIKCTEVNAMSSVYETEPWGKKDQRSFLNCVIGIKTCLDAIDLLNELKSIEKRAGRTGESKWSEREIDIDVLFYDNMIINDEKISIPHKEIENRRFVLVPMNEIYSSFIHPEIGKPVSQLLDETPDTLKVIKTDLKITQE